MEYNDFDQGVMKEVVHLLIIFSFMYYVGHFFYAPEHIVWDIEQLESCEVHENSNMICVNFGEHSFTREVLRDDFHHGGIPINKVTEREDSLSLIFVPWFDEWFIKLVIQVFGFKPLLTHIRYPCGSKNDRCGYGEGHTCKGHLIVLKV